ncbi:hypothetical protein ACYOEI_10710 [Singulisphaera rosea]
MSANLTRVLLAFLLIAAATVPTVPKPSVFGGSTQDDLSPSQQVNRPRGRTRSASPATPQSPRVEASIDGGGTKPPLAGPSTQLSLEVILLETKPQFSPISITYRPPPPLRC